MSRLTRDGTAEPVSRAGAYGDREKTLYPCSADHEQDWQPYAVDLYSAQSDDHIRTYASARGKDERNTCSNESMEKKRKKKKRKRKHVPYIINNIMLIAQSSR